MLPPSLRDEVLSNTYGEVIEKIKFFNEIKDPDFLWKVLPLLRPVKLEKNDALYWRGDHAEDSKLLFGFINFSIFYFERSNQALH
jgi:hypothetical protein